MRKIYMPTENELYQMQGIIGGDHMYKYLLIKAIEALIVNGLNYPARGILRNADEDIKNDSAIVHRIGLLYPYEIEHSQVAMNDSELCSKLLNGLEDRSIYGLDNLSRFSDEVNYYPKVIKQTVSTLADKLLDMPRYRFEYHQSPLLESIFGCDTSLLDHCSGPVILRELVDIEPGYALKLSDKDIEKHDMFSNRVNLLFDGFNQYRERYELSNYSEGKYAGKDILTDKDENVKRLIRTIYHDKNNLY